MNDVINTDKFVDALGDTANNIVKEQQIRVTALFDDAEKFGVGPDVLKPLRKLISQVVETISGFIAQITGFKPEVNTPESAPAAEIISRASDDKPQIHPPVTPKVIPPRQVSR